MSKIAIFFHGNYQNGNFFYKDRKMYKLSTILEKYGYISYFPDGFYSNERINNNCSRPRNWFPKDKSNTNQDDYDTINQNIHDLLEEYKISKYHDILLIGFSAGALIVDYIIRHNYSLFYNKQIKCIFSGFNGTTTNNLEIPNVSSLHIIGIHDVLVSKKIAKQIYKKWNKKNPLSTFVYYHSKHHIFPVDEKALDTIELYIKNQLKK